MTDLTDEQKRLSRLGHEVKAMVTSQDNPPNMVLLLIGEEGSIMASDLKSHDIIRALIAALGADYTRVAPSRLDA